VNCSGNKRAVGIGFVLILACADAVLSQKAGKVPAAQSVKAEPEDRPLTIDFAPDPEFPYEIITDMELQVILIAKFKKTGKVTDIKIISTRVPDKLPNALLAKLEQATTDAAKNIRFTPAMKNGHPISQRVEVVFTFKRVRNKNYSTWQPRLIA